MKICKINDPMYEEMVKEFHLAYGVAIEEKPVVPCAATCKLRIDLIREELNELEDAIKNGEDDLAHILKELADLQYVVSGTVLALGAADVFHEAFFRVHQSNMSKVCSDEETARSLTCGKGAIRQVDSGYVAYNAAGKVLKPPTYSPADLSDLVK